MDAAKQAGFDRFWKEYWPKCRRLQKKQAMQQWERLKPRDDGRGTLDERMQRLYDAIFAGLERQKKQLSWNTGDCRFIPYPHRWLRDSRWEDEIVLPEDKDAEALIEALRDHASVPPGFPKPIMDRFRRMCQRTRVNWPLLHHRAENDPDAGEKIKADFLATA